MTPTAAENVVAEWRAAMEGVTPGPWDTREASFDGEHEVYPTRPDEDLGGFGSWAAIATVSDGGDDEPAEANAAWIARCSPSGISGLLALIESQRATIEMVERERDSLQNSVNALDQERDGFAQLNAKLKADNKEMGAAFDVRWGATRRAIKLWQAANPGNDLTWPDHADLVVWSLGRVTALEAEKAGLVKLADGYGIVLMMIAAGCSDPQRFAKRMLAEYAPEANALKREQNDA